MKLCQEIETLEDFNDEFCETGTPSLDVDQIPCYLNHISGTENLPKCVPVSDYLELVAKQIERKDQIITFSVSSDEDRYQEWVDAALSVPGSSVTGVVRPYGAYHYTCYYCVVPVVPNLDAI